METPHVEQVFPTAHPSVEAYPRLLLEANGRRSRAADYARILVAEKLENAAANAAATPLESNI